MKKLIILLTIFLIPTAVAFSQIVSVEILSSVDKLKVGEEHPLAIVLRINPPFHINSNEPTDIFMIPTAVNLSPIKGISFGESVYPEAEHKKFSYSEKPLAVYENTIYIFFSITVSPEYQGKEVVLEGSVEYQACDEQSCLPPDEVSFSHTFSIAEANEEVKPINQDIFPEKPQSKEKNASEKSKKKTCGKAVKEKKLF